MKNFVRKMTFAICMVILSVGWAVAQTETVKHIVERGETLSSIAEHYSITKDRIIELNPSAAQFVYVGMELTIPVVSVKTEHKTTSNTDATSFQSNVNSSVYTKTQDSSFESNRKSSFFAIGYSASSFKDVKLSGSYGISWTILPWELADRFYLGVHFSPINFNFGLVDSSLSSDIIKLGPALGYYFTETLLVSMPINLCCHVHFGSNDKAQTAWGMELSPAVYLGNKYGIYLGPQLTIGFTEGAKPTGGFKAGFYF